MQALRSASFCRSRSFMSVSARFSVAIELPDGSDDCVELRLGQLRIDRKRQNLLRRALAFGERTLGVLEIGEARLQVKRQRIVDRMTDALRLEMGGELIAARHAKRVLVVDRHVPRLDNRRAYFRQSGESGGVVGRVPPAGGAPSFEMRQLRQKDGRLKRVESAVVPNLVVVIRLETSMHA